MIYALLAEGFEEIEALTVVDVLRRADIDIKTVCIGDGNTVKGAHNISVIADENIDNVSDFDMIFLPGGYPGYVNLENSQKVKDLLSLATSQNKYVAAICAAPSVLGKMGLLKGKKACCFPSFEDTLEGADVCFDDVVVSDKIITSKGAGTAHKLAFKLVEMMKSKALADKLFESMIF